MPETPDFDQIALGLMNRTDDEAGQDLIAEQLRLVWNARGAADIAKLEATITYHGGMPDAPLVKTLDRALRTLDR